MQNVNEIKEKKDINENERGNELLEQWRALGEDITLDDYISRLNNSGL